MKKKVARQLRKRQRQIDRRLKKARRRTDAEKPVLPDSPIHYDVADRNKAMPHGGLGVMHQMVGRLGLPRRIDNALNLLAAHRPYYESDHVLNIAYNLVCGGKTLQDIELRRNDEVFLDALGVDAIPDPTTAGDFCRRFSQTDIDALSDAINETRAVVWRRAGDALLHQRARIDADGTLLSTTGACKQGIGLSYNGVWGYHPLLVSLSNTQEPLFIINRPANRPSHEGAAAALDRAITLCRSAGFASVELRGDTDFSQTTHLDRWHDDGVFFVFGYDASEGIVQRAKARTLQYKPLRRRQKGKAVADKARRNKPVRHKAVFIEEKGYRNERLLFEEIASFSYRPKACQRDYRMVVLKKVFAVRRKGKQLPEETQYFFYLTNDEDLSDEDVVREANDRCDQENLIEQLKNGVHALRAPLDALLSNGAYMVIASLAWSLKAWMGLLMPNDDEQADPVKHRWVRWDFRTFRQAAIDFPVQILMNARQRIWRILAFRPQLAPLLVLHDAL